MYWLDADASDRRACEPWPEFVTRSAQEVLARFKVKIGGGQITLRWHNNGPFFVRRLRLASTYLITYASCCTSKQNVAEQTAEANRGRHPGFSSFKVAHAAPAAELVRL
jgi:hypothetical protein